MVAVWFDSAGSQQAELDMYWPDRVKQTNAHTFSIAASLNFLIPVQTLSFVVVDEEGLSPGQRIEEFNEANRTIGADSTGSI